MMVRDAERAMTFLESLPAAARGWCWMPTQYLMLTLPDDRGVYTAFEVKRCPQTGLEAYNVARYGPRRGDTP